MPDGRPGHARVDDLIAHYAASQHAIITREQLFSAGCDRNCIGYRLSIGRLHRMHPGVYAVGHRPTSPLALATAAVLACGLHAVLSHASAATLWGFFPRWEGPCEVTAPGAHRLRTVRVHRRTTLTELDVTRQLDIPVTTPARTALDLALRLDDTSLTRLINDGRLSGYLQPNDLNELIERSTGQKGVKRLRRCAGLDHRPTRSPLEDRFLAFTKRYGLPRPEVNTHVAGYEVDALFRQQRVVVELDGREVHDDPSAFEADRDKDADLTEAGYTCVRITDARLRRPVREATRLLKILEAER
jgi:hypothetical protein